MNKAWSFFWFVVACVVGAVILITIIKPYLTTIAVIGGIVLLVFVGYRTSKSIAERRRHF